MASHKATADSSTGHVVSEPRPKAAKVTETNTCGEFSGDPPNEICSHNEEKQPETATEPPYDRSSGDVLLNVRETDMCGDVPVTQPPDADECFNCVLLHNQKRMLRNRVLTLEEIVKKRKTENRKYRRNGKYKQNVVPQILPLLYLFEFARGNFFLGLSHFTALICSIIIGQTPGDSKVALIRCAYFFFNTT